MAHVLIYRSSPALETRTVTALGALPFVLMMATGSPHAFGREMTCYVIVPGDTAARLAQRLTGNVHNWRQPWFRIVNPTTTTFVAKSRYSVIQSGWRVCVATDRLRPAFVPQPRQDLLPSAPAVSQQADTTQELAAIDVHLLQSVASLFAVVSGVVFVWAARNYVRERRARLESMRGFASSFIFEFERPLFRSDPGEPAVQSWSRFAPARGKLEVLLAPADGRSYPNLFDHRKNVEYDVARVLWLLRDEPFVNGALYTRGVWVVIPFRFETNRQQEGVS